MIAEGVDANLGEFTWITPYRPADEMRIRISGESIGLTVEGEPFELKGLMELNLDNYPETMLTGRVLEINDSERPKIALVRHSSSNFKVVSRICTHDRCIVDWQSAQKEFFCSCHGSRFEALVDIIHGVDNDQGDLSTLSSSYNPSENKITIEYDASAF